jgi:hypothetical protein
MFVAFRFGFCQKREKGQPGSARKKRGEDTFMFVNSTRVENEENGNDGEWLKQLSRPDHNAKGGTKANGRDRRETRNKEQT